VSSRVVSGKYFQTLRRIAVHLNYHNDSDAQRVPEEGLFFFLIVSNGTQVTDDRGITEAPYVLSYEAKCI
jgi:hypothetical protein